MNLKKIETFIFDMDGTIIDAEKLNIQGYTETIKKFFGKDLTSDDYQKYFSGTKTAKAFTGYLESVGIIDYNVEELITYFREIKRMKLVQTPNEILTIFPNVVELLRILSDRGAKIVLATSTIMEFTNIILNHFDIKKYFTHILTAEDVVEGKPNPEIYLKALEISNSTNDTSVIFEDSKSGIQAALNSNTYCIGIHTKGLNTQYVNNANEVIEEYSEIINRLVRDNK